MDFLASPPYWAYILLIIAVVVPFGAAFVFTGSRPKRDEKKKGPSARAILFGISGLALLLLLGLWACDHFVESDTEQIDRKMHEMSAGVHERNMDNVFRHVSDSFHVGSANKAAFRQLADGAIQRQDITEIEVWDIAVESVSRETKTATVRFRFKPKGRVPENAGYIGKSKFVLDPDKEWRLQSIEISDSLGNPIQVQGL
jgi:hypothetical protein